MLAEKTGNGKAKILAETLDRATGSVLENGRSPSRKVGELDNRGSHFYLALYWAQELAGQTEDPTLAELFAEVADRLSAYQDKIAEEMLLEQGKPVDLGGYYRPDRGLRRGRHAPERDARRRARGAALSRLDRTGAAAMFSAKADHGRPDGQS